MKVLKKRVDWANDLDTGKKRMRTFADQLQIIKDKIESTKLQIDADPNATVEDKNDIQEAYTLVNHIKYTDFINFIQTQLN